MRCLHNFLFNLPWHACCPYTRLNSSEKNANVDTRVELCERRGNDDDDDDDNEDAIHRHKVILLQKCMRYPSPYKTTLIEDIQSIGVNGRIIADAGLSAEDLMDLQLDGADLHNLGLTDDDLHNTLGLNLDTVHSGKSVYSQLFENSHKEDEETEYYL